MALQMHRVEGLMMVDLVLLVGRVVSRPSVVQRVDPEGRGEGLKQGGQEVQESVRWSRLRRHLQPILVLLEEGLLPLPWPPIDAPILWRRYHRSRLSLRPP